MTPFLGFGLGARTEHFEAILADTSRVDWLEAITENFMVAGGKPRYYLSALRERCPVVLHGVSLSIGSVDPLDAQYLDRLCALIADVDPPWCSDHLCWTSAHGINSHDLLPLPWTAECLAHVAARIRQVQDRIQRPFLIENVSSYLRWRSSEMTEWAFLNALAEEAECGILLDVNNIHVSARNHGFDPHEYLDGISPGRVGQIHLAGHTDYGTHAIDTHDHDVCDAVWDLYQCAVERFGSVSCMIERDDHIPPYADLVDELDHARALHDAVPAAARALR